jgi:Protein of unknown function (DUF4242)
LLGVFVLTKHNEGQARFSVFTTFTLKDGEPRPFVCCICGVFQVYLLTVSSVYAPVVVFYSHPLVATPEREQFVRKEDVTMPLYMDIHHKVEGLTAQAVAQAHARDLEVQDKYGVKYLRYWYDEGTGKVFCLCEAPSKEAAEEVHREAHGLVADEITEVKEGA